MKRYGLLFLIILLGIWLLPVGIAGAAEINIGVDGIIYQPDPSFVGVDPFPLSGTVQFLNGGQGWGDLSGYDLYIRITNTSTYATTPVDFPATVLLTGVGFNLPEGVTIDTSTPGAMSLVNYNANSQSDPSKIWGYDDGALVEGGPFAAFPDAFTVNTVISTLEAAVDATFQTPAGVVDGPDGGILRAGTTISNKNYYTASAIIGLNLVGPTGALGFDSLVAAAEGGPVILAFGSPTATTVPEPSTMLLLGAGLIGLASFGRKRMFNK